MKVYDLTPVINERLAVFPGDVGYSREISLDFPKGHHLQLSSFRTTFHLGAHADSSSHYSAKGEGVDKRALSSFAGRAQVVRVQVSRGERVLPKHVTTEIRAPRVLFHTGTFPDPAHWNSDFASLSPELIEFLHGKGVKLVGIDTPSVDPEDSKALESHQALSRTGMAVLEGLLLERVSEGIYTLAALPLPFEGADASPVRALLFEKPDLFPEEKWEIT